MTDRLPYEEQLSQQLTDLPLPDENTAWADMERRLKEGDDDRIIPVWLRGCGPWALLVLIVLGIGWWLIGPKKWGHQQQATQNMTTARQKQGSSGNNSDLNDTMQLAGDADNTKIRRRESIIPVDPASGSDHTHPTGVEKKRGLKKSGIVSVQIENTPLKNKKRGSGLTAGKTGNPQGQTSVAGKNKKPTGNDQSDISIPLPAKEKVSSTSTEIKNKPVDPFVDSTVTVRVPVNQPDTAAMKPRPDSAVKIRTETAGKKNEPKKDGAKPKNIQFGAGLGMHQLLPIDGQRWTPYSASGRKGSLADYIPSVWFRMYKNNKWFLQGEFRYGAPQYTREFTYDQKTQLDTIGPLNNHIIITSNKLKKTFYHQLPLTFNYFVRPNWSVGTGLVWNKFVSAISQEEAIRRNISTLQDSLVGNKIVKNRNDTSSVFKQSYFQAVIETHYRWRRFSLGAKYSFGLQPYIRFALPGGPPQQEKNKSLQIFLRYELWKSKTKK